MQQEREVVTTCMMDAFRWRVLRRTIRGVHPVPWSSRPRVRKTANQVLLAQPVAPSAPGTHVPLRKRSKQLKGELGGLGRAGGRAGGARSASLQG